MKKLIGFTKTIIKGQRTRRHMKKGEFTFQDYGGPESDIVELQNCTHAPGDTITRFDGRQYQVQDTGQVVRVAIS